MSSTLNLGYRKPTEKDLNARLRGKRMKKLTGRWPTQFWVDGWRQPNGSMWLRGWRFMRPIGQVTQ